MRKGQREQFELELEIRDEELLSRLERALPRAAMSGETLFVNSSNVPGGHLLRWSSSDAEGIFQLALTCVELRDRLGLPRAPSLADEFLKSCTEAGDVANDHRRGPRRLAAALLEIAREHRRGAAT